MEQGRQGKVHALARIGHCLAIHCRRRLRRCLTQALDILRRDQWDLLRKRAP